MYIIILNSTEVVEGIVPWVHFLCKLLVLRGRNVGWVGGVGSVGHRLNS